MNNHGHHILLDLESYPISNNELDHFAPDIEQMILHLLSRTGIECVNHIFKKFDGTTNPAGIASVFCLTDSHMSFHMYSDKENKSLFAIDLFTCGIPPEKTKEFVTLLLKYLKEKIGHVTVKLRKTVKRFKY